MRKTRRRTKEKNKKYTRKRKKSKEKNNQTNKTKPIQEKRWVAFWRLIISIYNRTIFFLWLQPLFSRRSTKHALAENTFAFQVKSIVHMDGNNRGSTADFICSHCIDCLYLFDLPWWLVTLQWILLPREQYPMQSETGKVLLSFSAWRSSEGN